MATFEQINTWKTGIVNVFECLTECDQDPECVGVRHEKYTARCALLYDKGLSESLGIMSTTNVYVKATKCPSNTEPEVVTDYNTTDFFCDYVEYDNGKVIGLSNYTVYNKTVDECLTYCDTASMCAYVTLDDTGECTVFGYSSELIHDVDNTFTVFKKTASVTNKCTRPFSCNYDNATVVQGNAGLENYIIDDYSFLETYESCVGLCNTLIECKSFSFEPCVFYNITLMEGPNATYYKNDPDCGVNYTFIEAPVLDNITIAPTVSPTWSPTISPTASPTAAPIDQFESALETLCDYASLPAFQPRIDGKVVLGVENDVNASIHCLLSCDSNTLCVGSTYLEDLEECVYYTAIGPIELDFLNPHNQTLFIKSGRCHKIHFSNDTLCDYSTRDEEFPIRATHPEVIPSVIKNVTVITNCAEACDTDLTCQYFTYNEMSKECLFYNLVESWGISSFATTFEKTEEFCAWESTINNTRAPTGTPTAAPTAGDPTVSPTVGSTRIGISLITMVLVCVYATVCCLVFVCLLFTDPRDDEDGLYFLVIPETLTYEIEF